MITKILLTLLGAITATFAQTYTVSTTAEFRQALENATVNGETDTIVVKAGTYKTTDDGLGAFKFSDTEPYSLTIKAYSGLSAKDVIFSGNHSSQVFNLTNAQNNSSFIFKNISTIDGNTSYEGGGIYSDSNLTIVDCNVSNNTSLGAGGGILSTKDIIIKNSTVSNNSFLGNGGGVFSSGAITIINSSISNNIFIDIYYTSTGSTSGRSNGGGIYTTNGVVTITNSIISNNVTKYNGGGIYLNNGSIIIINSTISNNIAKYDGGGIYTMDNDVAIVNSIISNNSSLGSGAGLFVSRANIINSIISNNISILGNGGGIYAYNINIINSIILNNSSQSGSGVYGNGNFINSIFKDNNNSDIYFVEDSKVYNSFIDYTKLQNESSYTIIKKNNIQSTSSPINFTDTSYRLNQSSPAVNKGLDPYSDTFKNLLGDKYAQVIGYLKTDKDGNTRIAGGTIDIGAYENGSVKVCAQVITYATEPLSGTCKEYTTPCDVPNGWQTVAKCPSITAESPTLIAPNNEIKSHIESLPSGWSLAGTSTSVADLSIFNSAKIIWFYKSNKWYQYEPSKGTQLNMSIKSYDGFWVYK